MAIDYQSILAGLTIATGIFLAGRFLGKLEEKLKVRESEEDELRSQIEYLESKLSNHVSRTTSTESNGKQGGRELS